MKFKIFQEYLEARLKASGKGGARFLAEQTGISESEISLLRHGRNKRPRFYHVIKIARHFGDDPAELLRLAGYDTEAEEYEKLATQDLAVAEGRDSYYTKVATIGYASADSVEFRLKYTDQDLPLGGALEHVRVPEKIKAPNVYSLIIRGNSLEPVFLDGTKIVVSPNEPFVSGHIYIVRTTDDDSLIKIVYLKGDIYLLRSINPLHKPITYHKREIVWLHRVTWIKTS